MSMHYPHDDVDDQCDEEREPKPFHRCPWPLRDDCRQCADLDEEEEPCST